MVAMHSPNTFYQKDARKELYLSCWGLKYNIEYEVKVEKQYKHGETSCRNYNFDNDCIERKFKEDIPKKTSEECSVPTNSKMTPICINPDDMKTEAELAKEKQQWLQGKKNVLVQNMSNAAVI